MYIALAFGWGNIACSAQEALQVSRWSDNWYVGVQAGAATKTTNNDWLLNMNPQASLRVGRSMTPVFGWTVDAAGYFSDYRFGYSPSVVKSLNAHLLANVNLSRWLGGYPGRPRRVEVAALAGPGINHIFGLTGSEARNNNDLTAKMAMNLLWFLGSGRQCQLYLEPALLFNLDRYSRTGFHIDYSAVQLSVGLNYLFRNSNGTHHFRKYAVYSLPSSDAAIGWDLADATVTTPKQTVDKKVSEKEQNALEKKQAKELKALEKKQAKEQKALEQKQAKEQKQPAVVEQPAVAAVQPSSGRVQPSASQTVPETGSGDVWQVIAFDKNSLELAEGEMSKVSSVAFSLKTRPRARIRLVGLAAPGEEQGTLARERAESVRALLMSRFDVNPSRIAAEAGQAAAATGQVRVYVE